MTSCRDMRELVSVSLDRALTPLEQARLDAHLVECPGCTAIQKEFQMVRQQMRSLESVEPPPWMTARIMARVKAEATGRPSFWERHIRPLIIKPHYQVATLLLLCGTGYYLLKTHGSVENPSALLEAEKPLAQLRKESAAAPSQKPADRPSEPAKLKDEPTFAAPPPTAAALPKSVLENSGPGASMSGRVAEVKAAETPKQESAAAKPQSSSPAPAPVVDSMASLGAGVTRDQSAQSPQRAKKAASTSEDKAKSDAKEARESDAEASSFEVHWEPTNPISAKHSLEKELSRLGGEVLAQPEGRTRREMTVRLDSRRLPEFMAWLARIGVIRAAPDPSRTSSAIVTVTIRW